MFIIISGGPDEIPFSKYFETRKQAEQLLLDNGFFEENGQYYIEQWSNDFMIDGEEFGFQAYIIELTPYSATT